MQTITVNGQEVDCYGTWEDDSNLECVFEDEMLDNVWCGEDGIDTLYKAVKALTAYAARHNTTLIQVECV